MDAIGGSSGISHGVKHDELSVDQLPKKNIFRLMKEFLPNRVMIGEDAKKAIMHSLPIFASYLTHAARDIKDSKGEATITEDHVFAALETILGLEGFIPDLKTGLDEYIASGGPPRPKKKVDFADGTPGNPGDAHDEDEDDVEDEEDDGDDGAEEGSHLVEHDGKPPAPMKVKLVLGKLGQPVVSSNDGKTPAAPLTNAPVGRPDSLFEGSSMMSSVGSVADSDDDLNGSGSRKRARLAMGLSEGDSSSVDMNVEDADRKLGGDNDDPFD